jgi:hypothetical protein
MEDEDVGYCAWCQTRFTKPVPHKRFCNSTCHDAWWNAQRQRAFREWKAAQAEERVA